MAEDSGISWTDNTFNPWMGCTKVSPACKFCYAERDMDHRHGKVAWGPNGTRVLTTTTWPKPVRWNKDAAIMRKRIRVFCASLADVFEEWDGPIVNATGEKLFWQTKGRWDLCLPKSLAKKNRSDAPVTMSDIRVRLFNLIDATPNLDWLLLTKRPENILRMWPRKLEQPSDDWCNRHLDSAGRHRLLYRHNVWLGTSVESQEYADMRIPELLKCRDLAPVLFLSCEPLVGPVNLHPWLCYMGDIAKPEQRYSERICKPSGSIDWVITGGESGPEARPNHPEWFRSLREQSKAAGVPFHFKQWGEWVPGDHECVTFADNEVLPWHDKEGSDTTPMCRVGKVRAGRMLDGVEHDAFPEVKL